ncbi:MAG: PepSY domain-containing protein [Hyphomicrobiaceae bacterium]|nr:PepSY domain-containing protein [Hyphomicrobiaceae bacterium]
MWLRQATLKLHRKIGVLASFFVILLSLTGLTLNHTVDLELDSHIVNVLPLNMWYGLAPKSRPKTYNAGKLWITVLDKSLYIGHYPVGNITGHITGVIAWEDGVLVAQSRELTFYSNEGQVFDQKNFESLPGVILEIGKTKANQVALKTDTGIFSANAELENWQPIKENIVWAKSSIAPEKLTTEVIEIHSGRGLPASRIILDLHSGRIFGRWGAYVMDGAAILLLLLTMTGLYNWSKRRR